MFGPDTSNGLSIRIYPKVGSSSPPKVETVSVSKKFDTFTRTSVRVSKMNGVARARLTFQMLTLLKNIRTGIIVNPR